MLPRRRHCGTQGRLTLPAYHAQVVDFTPAKEFIPSARGTTFAPFHHISEAMCSAYAGEIHLAIRTTRAMNAGTCLTCAGEWLTMVDTRVGKATRVPTLLTGPIWAMRATRTRPIRSIFLAGLPSAANANEPDQKWEIASAGHVDTLVFQMEVRNDSERPW